MNEKEYLQALYKVHNQSASVRQDNDMYLEILLMVNKQMTQTIDKLRKKIDELEKIIELKDKK